ncbi:response regulator [Elusimicrobiota bacterium]
MEPAKHIISAEDDPAISMLIRDALTISGYEVTSIDDGSIVVETVKKKQPDLLLLDIGLPGVSGLDICKIIKQDIILRHIPIIMLTAMGSLADKVKGLDTGADDYLAKPFEVEELLAKIRTLLRTVGTTLDANPLSYLPGNKPIDQKIRDLIQNKELFAVLYVDLNNFKAYNDYYGFNRGDNVIQETAKILLDNTEQEKDFVGHIGGDDFIVVTHPGRYEALCRNIISAFDKMSPVLYDEQERDQGFIEISDRQGNMAKFAFLSIAIGVVMNTIRPLGHIGEVSSIGSEMKHYVKTHFQGSAYAVDKRTSSYRRPQLKQE